MHKSSLVVRTVSLLLLGFTAHFVPTHAAEPWRVGFSKVDITPDEPQRLSGYATRIDSHTGVADPLFARAMVVSPTDPSLDARTLVLVSIDSIAVTSPITVELAAWLNEKYSIPRSQLALCSTHSHAAPHIDGALKNLFRQPSTPAQTAASQRYTQRLSQAIRQAIEQALAARDRATLSIGQTEIGFAINRRVLKDNVWTGFGEQSDAPVDSRVRLLIAHGEAGNLMGAAYMVACHCTTLGGDFNQISADWAGLSASRLELLHAGSVFLPVIGCGADANPNPRGTYELAQQHAAELVGAIQGQLADGGQRTPLDSWPIAHFGYAGLATEQPSEQAIQRMLDSEKPNEKPWAQHMLKTKQDMGRLPETYPMPIHTWQFGEQLTWVFLGGEVVVDYQFQIEKELPTRETWVAAYTDDVFAYVASERMRSEGGYEVDFSMIYYQQPGRWQSGTQSLIVRRVAEILRDTNGEDRPLEAADALASMRVPDDYRVDLMAAEPLLQDPINIAFGPDGRVWVVEMNDYPLGVPGGGRVKWLRDTNGDGQLDEAHVFLDGLPFPSSVMAWKTGALIIAAPNILYAEDRDGDGRAETTEILVTGISEANPQHRASGFEIGLDGWLHFTPGHGTKQLTSTRNSQTYLVDHRDCAWNPETGELLTTSGETQFVRGRDAYGNWFGNSNSEPMYQYVVEDRYLSHASISGGARQHLLTPAVAPPVRPRSRTVDRFNDLYASNRFTSACSSIVVRVPGIGQADQTTALICEPVHNLVARVALNTTTSGFTAERHSEDSTYEFFTSTDPWSRPVRAVNAPDGTIWIVDMVRRVIEHPEWIPTAWQERMDVRSGSHLGRIYRVHRRDYQPTQLPNLVDASSAELARALVGENGALRDLALQVMLGRDDADLESSVRDARNSATSPAARASVLGCLTGKGWLTSEDILGALHDTDARIVRLAIEYSERLPTLDARLQKTLDQVVDRELGPAVDLQWILTATRLTDLFSGDAKPFDSRFGLKKISARSLGDRWITRALSLIVDSSQAIVVVQEMFQMWGDQQAVPASQFAEVTQSAEKLWNRCEPSERDDFAIRKLNAMLDASQSHLTPSQMLLVSVLAASSSKTDNEEFANLLPQVTKRLMARMLAGQLSEPEQLHLVNLLGSGLFPAEEELLLASQFLSSERTLPVQRMTIEALRRFRGQEISQLLVAKWPSFDSNLRSTAGATLLTRQEWTSDLVNALEAGSIQRNELDLATLQQLQTYDDRELRNRCVELFGKPTQRSQVVAEYLTALPSPTKTAAGEKSFAEHCAACHQGKDGKQQLGPPLENLRHWTLDQWATAILDPNQAVEPKYRQSNLLTSDGQIVAGIVIERDPHHVVVAVSDGSLKTLVTESIESEKDTGVSLMPVGFEQKLSPQQLAELIGFVRSR